MKVYNFASSTDEEEHLKSFIGSATDGVGILDSITTTELILDSLTSAEVISDSLTISLMQQQNPGICFSSHASKNSPCRQKFSGQD